MFLRRPKSHTTRRWHRALILLFGMVLITGIALLTYEQAKSASAAQPPLVANADSKFYSEDLTVEERTVIDDDVVVFSGNVWIKPGGTIKGDLIVYSGNIRMDAESTVEGDVTSLSGNTEIAGIIEGDLVVWSGDIDLLESAAIDGDISVMSGNIRRARGTVVQGNVVAGGFKMPELPDLLGNVFSEEAAAPEAPVAPVAPEAPIAPIAPVAPRPEVDMAVNRAGGVGSAIFALLGRLVVAGFGATLLIVLTTVLYHLRPGFIHSVQQTMQTQRPLSFAVGLTINVVLIFLTGVLVVTLCLAPVGLAAGLVFATLNLVGWAALSLTVGGRLLRAAKLEAQPLTEVLIGAFLMTGVLALGWALGGCFRPLAILASLAISAFGGGAVVVYWLKLGVNRPANDAALSV